MKNTVILKGNKYGLSIVLNEEAEFSQIIEDLTKRLENAEDFFDSERQLVAAFEGRTLKNEELDQLLAVIEANSKLNIQYVMDENSELETTFFDIIHSEENRPSDKTGSESYSDFADKDSSLFDNTGIKEVTPLFSTGKNGGVGDVFAKQESQKDEDGNGMFYKGTLRSGQSLEAKASLVIIGDVNPGATVIAGGNIIIIGTLKGSVKAGAKGDRQSFVMALAMNPIQIQIADVIAQNFNDKQNKHSKQESAIARISHGEIIIDTVSKASFQDINI